MTIVKAFQHSCGGWYAAEENEAGFHGQPEYCVGQGRCYNTPYTALHQARCEEEKAKWFDDGTPKY